jgi:hypothetical protein
MAAIDDSSTDEPGWNEMGKNVAFWPDWRRYLVFGDRAVMVFRRRRDDDDDR